MAAGKAPLWPARPVLAVVLAAQATVWFAAAQGPTKLEGKLGELGELRGSALRAWGTGVASGVVPDAWATPRTEGLVEACTRMGAVLLAAPQSRLPLRVPASGSARGGCARALLSARPGVQADWDVLHECGPVVHAVAASLGVDSGSSENIATLCNGIAARILVQDPDMLVLGQNATDILRSPLVHVTEAEDPTLLRQAKADKMSWHSGDVPVDVMTAACLQTLEEAEKGVKSAQDAMKLGNTVAPMCESVAREQLGVFINSSSLSRMVHGWCKQLDGRLTLALETGFLFSSLPRKAEKQAGRTNPYLSVTRHLFCSRFITAIQLGVGGASRTGSTSGEGASLGSKLRVMATDTVRALGRSRELGPMHDCGHVGASGVGATREAAALAASPGSARVPTAGLAANAAGHSAPAEGTPAGFEGPATGPTLSQPPPAPPRSRPGAVGMLPLFQRLGASGEWLATCEVLVAGLTSKAGSITDAQALGGISVQNGGEVLAFNSHDQAQIRKCAASLETMAAQLGIVSASAAKRSAGSNAQTFLQGANLRILRDGLDTSGKSLWARDACEDIAHGFLTERIVNHRGELDFCKAYSEDLREMHGGDDGFGTSAQEDVRRLRGRARARALLRGLAGGAGIRTQRPRVLRPEAFPPRLSAATRGAHTAAGPSALVVRGPVAATVAGAEPTSGGGHGARAPNWAEARGAAFWWGQLGG